MKKKTIEKTVPKKKTAVSRTAGYGKILSELSELLESARSTAARHVNSIMTATYWEVGRRIVVHEQGGSSRAAYGEELIVSLARDLSARFGRGFGLSQLKMIRQFYLNYQDPQKSQSAIGQFKPSRPESLADAGALKSQSPIGLSHTLRTLVEAFPLPWTHYARLLRLRNNHARRFYEIEALRGGWTARQLDRQINTQFYERTALSRNKTAMLTKGALPKPCDAVSSY